jgi:hypothetical protein
MDADEREVFDFLSNYGEEWISAKEVCRRAGGKRRFTEDNNWAVPVLKRLKDSQAIEVDTMGRYRIPPATEEEHHVSDEANPEQADAASGEHHEQD